MQHDTESSPLSTSSTSSTTSSSSSSSSSSSLEQVPLVSTSASLANAQGSMPSRLNSSMQASASTEASPRSAVLVSSASRGRRSPGTWPGAEFLSWKPGEGGADPSAIVTVPLSVLRPSPTALAPHQPNDPDASMVVEDGMVPLAPPGPQARSRKRKAPTRELTAASGDETSSHVAGEEKRKRSEHEGRRNPRDQEGGEQVHFSNLPEEVKLHIFAFVPIDQVQQALPLVCRSWHHLAADESLWRNLHALHFGGARDAQRPASTWRNECSELMRHLRFLEGETRLKISKLFEEYKVKIIEEQQCNRQQRFVWACKYGHIRVVEDLYARFSSQINLNMLFISDQYQRTPLMAAIEGGHMEVAQFLVSKRANMNAGTPAGWTALMIAANKGKMREVEFLVSHGTDVNAMTNGGCTALMFAAEKGHHDIVDFLLVNSADANACSNKGWSSLIIAANKGHKQIVAALLAKQADTSAATNDGLTALMTASYKGRESVVELLLSHNVNVNATANLAVTALMGAADKGHARIVELLLRHGAEVNATTDDGWTALMGAADNGHVEIVRLLLANNADINIVRSNGDTALIVATDRGHTEVVRELEEKKRQQQGQQGEPPPQGSAGM